MPLKGDRVSMRTHAHLSLIIPGKRGEEAGVLGTRPSKAASATLRNQNK